jgi:DNA-binding NarL/FixJ family response regulator
MLQPKERPFTVRQMEVARALAEGLSIRQIACKLGIAPGTVQVHLNKVYWKAGVKPDRRRGEQTSSGALPPASPLVDALINMGVIEQGGFGR